MLRRGGTSSNLIPNILLLFRSETQMLLMEFSSFFTNKERTLVCIVDGVITSLSKKTHKNQTAFLARTWPTAIQHPLQDLYWVYGTQDNVFITV